MAPVRRSPRQSARYCWHSPNKSGPRSDVEGRSVGTTGAIFAQRLMLSEGRKPCDIAGKTGFGAKVVHQLVTLWWPVMKQANSSRARSYPAQGCVAGREHSLQRLLGQALRRGLSMAHPDGERALQSAARYAASTAKLVCRNPGGDCDDGPGQERSIPIQ